MKKRVSSAKVSLFIILTVTAVSFQNCGAPVANSDNNEYSHLGAKVPATSHQGEKGYDIIIVAGQSNAQGACFGPFSDPYENKTNDNKIFQVGRRNTDNLKVIPAIKKINGVSSDVLQHWNLTHDRVKLGLGISFARRYAKHDLKTGRKVLIVPAAYGGSSILEWLGEQTAVGATGSLFDDMKERIDFGLHLKGQNKIVAVLWHQGEADINNTIFKRYGMNHKVYGDMLKELFDNIRTEFPSDPFYPILTGMPVFDWFDAMNLRPRQIAGSFIRVIKEVSEEDPLAIRVSSNGLESNYPNHTDIVHQRVHFSCDALVTYGQRYFNNWRALVQEHH